jgi:hypothetical protein
VQNKGPGKADEQAAFREIALLIGNGNYDQNKILSDPRFLNPDRMWVSKCDSDENRRMAAG